VPRLVFFNDPHFSRHPPECRAESYPHEILDKFHQVAEIAAKLGAVAIGCSGDWFHRKGKVTFREGNDILTVLRSWQDRGLQPIGILGNHDIAGHDLESLDGRAVGALVHSKVLQLLDHEPYCASDDGAVYVTGTSFFHGCDANDEARIRMYGAEVPWEIGGGPRHGIDSAGQPNPVHIHVAHGTLVKRSFFEDYTRMDQLVKLLAKHDRLPDVIVCGHLHYSEGITMFDRPGGGKVAICRIGSLGRVASDDLDRQPQALVIAIKGAGFVCKPISIGKDPLRGEIRAGSGITTTEETEQRVQEFVRILREEADAWSLVDHGTLLARVSGEMGHGKEALRVAQDAVERRQ